jgi:type IV secretion system protein VirD4
LGLCLAFLWVLLSPAVARADAAADTRNLARELVEISYIESERRMPSVPDDFAADALKFSRQQVAAAPTGIRPQAERIAAQIRNAPRKTAWLKGWPDPWKVRADIAAASRGESDLVISARQAGRFLMFDTAMNRFGGTVFNDRLPQDVQRLQIAYQAHYFDLRDRQLKTFEDGCPKSGPCRRRTFHEVSGDYHFNIEQARDAATRYLPSSIQAQFIELTAPTGTRAPRPAPPVQVGKSADTGGQFWSNVTGIIFAGIGLFLLIAFLRFLAQKGGERTTSTAYGSARFATPETGLPPTDKLFHGMFFGFSYQEDPKATPLASPIVSAPENHTLIVAPSRTGKGTRVVIPTLLLYKDSLITLDPKGENAAIAARYRRDELGHKVHIVNPWGVDEQKFERRGFKSATINPLDALDPSDRNVVATAQALADAICIRPSSGDDAFWQGQAAVLLTGLLLWVADQPDEVKTLGRVADLVSGGEGGDDLRNTLLPKLAASSSFRGAIRKAVGPMVKMPDNTWGGVISNLSGALKFLIDDRIVEATDHSTFDLSDLTRPGTTVFLVIPDIQLKTNPTWMKLILAAVSSTFKRHRPAAEGRRAMFLIDEFAAMGRVDSFVSDIAIVGGAGLDLTIAIQDLGQLDEYYGKASASILSNCGWKWFCNVQDLKTAEYVSKMLGTMTQPTESQNIGPNGSSMAYGETARPLRTPDEIMAMGKNFAMVFRPGDRPYAIAPCDYWNLKQAFGRLLKTKPDYPMPNFDAVDPSPSHKSGGSQGGSSGGQGAGNGGGGSSSRGMNRSDALDILGLKEGATQDEIRAAWKTRVNQVHPDKPGGSTRLTQQVNEAYDYLKAK